MSAVNSTSFANKKPILEGDLITTVGTTSGSLGSQVLLSAQDGVDHLISSMAVTPTKATNLVILRFSIYATNDSNIEIREGASVLATIDGVVTGTRTINLVLEDVSIATHTYDCYTIFDTQLYQYSTTGFILYAAPVDIDDTHSTKNANIISG